MSYLTKISYNVIPQESYQIIHNCSGCGCKSHFINTNTFRVNANGNMVDVWLIYQCETCKHTLNLTIYERQNPASIPAKEWKRFLANDPQLCRQYGMDKCMFAKNKKRIDLNKVSYLLEQEIDQIDDSGDQEAVNEKYCIEIKNEYGLKLRMDKLISSLLHMSRSQERKAEEQGIITCQVSEHQKNMKIYIQSEPCII